jgi:hypothetical protein
MFEKGSELTGEVMVNVGTAVANWPEAACIRADEQHQRVRSLWSIGIPEPAERPIGYSVLDPRIPIFIDRGGKHSESDPLRGTAIVTEGFYEKTTTGGRIEVNPKPLMHTTEKYRAIVLGHEELHGVLEWLDPVRLNEAILPAHAVAKARTKLREVGYEGAEVDYEILPRLVTHDPDGTGLPGMVEEDRVISEAMRRLLAESETDTRLKRVYSQLQQSHALIHDVMSGKAGIEALVCGCGQPSSRMNGSRIIP